MFLNPFGQFRTFISPRETLIRKYHYAVISFSSDGSPDTLRCMSHGIKRQKVVLSYLKFYTVIFKLSYAESAPEIDPLNTPILLSRFWIECRRKEFQTSRQLFLSDGQNPLLLIPFLLQLKAKPRPFPTHKPKTSC